MRVYRKGWKIQAQRGLDNGEIERLLLLFLNEEFSLF